MPEAVGNADPVAIVPVNGCELALVGLEVDKGVESVIGGPLAE